MPKSNRTAGKRRPSRVVTNGDAWLQAKQVEVVAMAMHAGREMSFEPKWRATWKDLDAIPSEKARWREQARAFLRALRKP